MAKHNELVKHLGGFEIPSEIIDDETGQKLPSDPEKIKRALEIISEVRNDIKRLAKNVREFFVDERLYLYLGLTKAEAAQQYFGMSENSLRRFERIGKAFDQQKLESIAMLGVGKLDALSQLSEDQRNELLESKVIQLSDGTKITLDDIKDATVIDLEKRIKTLRHKSTKLETNLKETKLLHESEAKDLRKQIKELEELTDIPPEERHFYERVTKIRESRSVIYEAKSAFHAAFMAVHRIEITDSNRDITAEIEGLLITVSRQILQAEEHFGITLGHLKADIINILEASK